MKTKPETFSVTIVAKPRHTILHELAKRLGGASALADELGVCSGTVSAWLNLRYMPRLGKGKGRFSLQRRHEIVVKLMHLTGRRIEDIFPNFVREKLHEIPRKVEVTRTIDRRALADAARDRLTLPNPADVIQERDQREAAKQAMPTLLKHLSERERRIVSLRFGLDGDEYTLLQCAKTLGVTKERIRQLEAKALLKLRHAAIENGQVRTLRELAEP